MFIDEIKKKNKFFIIPMQKNPEIWIKPHHLFKEPVPRWDFMKKLNLPSRYVSYKKYNRFALAGDMRADRLMIDTTISHNEEGGLGK